MIHMNKVYDSEYNASFERSRNGGVL